MTGSRSPGAPTNIRSAPKAAMAAPKNAPAFGGAFETMPISVPLVLKKQTAPEPTAAPDGLLFVGPRYPAACQLPAEVTL